jgi:hypothetical protein
LSHPWCLGLLLCAALACSPSSSKSGAPPEVAQAEPVANTLPNADWGTLELPSIPLVLTLPDHRYWSARLRGTFVEVVHAASSSRLTLRLWRAPRLVRPSECEAEARLARPDLPRVAADTELERTQVDYPQGFHTELSVGVEPIERGARGHAVAVGATTGRCVFLSFETVASGVRAAEEVADRLSVAVEGILPRVRVPSIDGRASSIASPAEAD